ncbi:hypothetical protein [Undibacterium danionis]|uniref:Uncharacterized protein n=1 Tax=Undibacterium danionis TaxID=1812100 RepID=A0ABV6IF88_9BURK
MQNNLTNIITVIFIAILAFVIITAILQWLWNMTIPDVFGFKKITFWQALRLILIGSILFGSHPKISKDFSLSLNHKVSIVA